MTTSTAFVAVYSIPLERLRGACVDIVQCNDSTCQGASPCRYRLIDCVQYTHHDKLIIHEFDELPKESFSAISYIWRGKPLDQHVLERRGTFSVKGAEDGDPISMDVLHHACAASLQKNAKFLWLDRLCIIQTSRDDKAWQIQRMYGIYKACDPCLVLPGGVQRLVSLDEETVWIQRGWTLQEVMAPDEAFVLFRWDKGAGWFIGPAPITGDLEVVVSGESAVAKIMDLLLPYLGGVMGGQTYCILDDDDEDDDPTAEQVRIEVKPVLFGRTPSHALALIGALWPRDPDTVPQAIWRSALLRVSSRPVDMVFATMGMFGVTLDPRAFQKDDRLGATIALAQEILRKGGSASWLVATLNNPPERRLSTFPAFPTTSVDGKALLQIGGVTRELAEVIGDEFLERWSLKETALTGSMDDDGYFKFSSKAVCVRRANRAQSYQEGQPCQCDPQQQVFMTALDGSVWEVFPGLTGGVGQSTSSESSRAFVVYLGMALANPYSSQPTLHRYLQTYTLLGMLVQEHSSGKFHRTSNLVLCHCFEDIIKLWDVQEFCVGPNVDDSLTYP